MHKGTSSFGFLARAVVMMLALPVFGFAQDDAEAAARKRLRLKDNAADFWIYDDLEKGFAQARAGGKPLVISFRCVP